MAKPTQTQLLIKLVKDLHIDLLHTGDKECFATVPCAGGTQTLPIISKVFNAYLVHCYFEKYSTVPSETSVQNVIRTLGAQALYKSQQELVFTRYGSTEKANYLDLGTARGEVVEIRSDGWEILKRKGPRFWRPNNMEPLPYPERGGSIQLLRELVNIVDEHEWICFVGWLVSAFQRGGAYAILNILGQYGSAKSNFMKMILRLTDPRKGELRGPPTEERSLAITASQSWVMGFNNVSHLSAQMSDAMCRLSTGGGLVTRKLYTDNEEVTFEMKRPIVINSIDLATTRSDFLDRCIIITLPRITDDKRLPEQVLWERFDEAKPLILGAILDVVSCAMKHLPMVKLDRYPRMADLARFVTAAEPGLGWKPGTFVAAYALNEANVHSVVLAASELAVAIELYLKRKPDYLGTATTLLQKLRASFKHFKSLPSSPAQLGYELNRLAPNLRHIGINVSQERGKTSERRRYISIRKLNTHIVIRPDGKRKATVGAVQTSAKPHSPEPRQSHKGEVKEWTR